MTSDLRLHIQPPSFYRTSSGSPLRKSPKQMMLKIGTEKKNWTYRREMINLSTETYVLSDTIKGLCDAIWALRLLLSSGLSRLKDPTFLLVLLKPQNGGKPIGGNWERVQAGGGINILPPNDHQRITTITLHIYFGLLRPLWTSTEPPDTPDTATLTLHYNVFFCCQNCILNIFIHTPPCRIISNGAP